MKHKTTSNEKTKDVTRTITIVKPDGSKEVIKQIVTFTRTATFDEVTGKITYSDWKFDKSNAADPAKSQWDAYDVPTIAGYTPSQAAVAAKAVEVTTADEAITITYTQDEVVPPIPKPDDGKDDKPDESDKPQPKPTPEPDNNPELPSKPSTDETEVHVHSKDKIKSGPAVIKAIRTRMRLCMKIWLLLLKQLTELIEFHHKGLRQSIILQHQLQRQLIISLLRGKPRRIICHRQVNNIPQLVLSDYLQWYWDSLG